MPRLRHPQVDLHRRLVVIAGDGNVLDEDVRHSRAVRTPGAVGLAAARVYAAGRLDRAASQSALPSSNLDSTKCEAADVRVIAREQTKAVGAVGSVGRSAHAVDECATWSLAS